jgi:FKBP-type peptidyl-prolyl cis-trans isomerase SlyD
MNSTKKDGVMARVLSFHYTLTDPEGNTIDQSDENEPLSYLEGVGQIIPGLEEKMKSLRVGDKRKFEIPAAQAYGPIQEEAIVEVPRREIPNKDIKVGDQFTVQAEHGQGIVKVHKISETHVTLDANHPLAGLDLTFDIEVTEIREATEEETQHGHAHGAGGHHH